MLTEATELHYKTATELVALLRAGELSCVELMQASLARIDACNPKINAIVTLDAEQSLAQAHKMDALRQKDTDLPALFGLPVAHKDMALTRGMRTTFGSLIYQDNIPDTDSLLVQRMRAAGAISIGKTNTPEFGAGSHTFNKIFGTTLNPYNMALTAGGSSGGAAAALAAGMVSLADGSDMGGSLRNPASFCNVVGLRPAPGRIPGWPNELGWFTLGVEGPMARTVEDVALFLSVIAGPDSRSPIAIDALGSVFKQSLETDFSGRKIAFSPDFGKQIPVQSEIIAVLEESIKYFSLMGMPVELAIPDFSDADVIFKTLRSYSYAATLGRLFADKQNLMKPVLQDEILQGQKLSAEDLASAHRKRTRLYLQVVEFMQEYDYLLLPVTQVEPFSIDLEYPVKINNIEMTTYIDWMRACYYISVPGLPAVSVPAGFSRNGLPVGLQIVGKPRDELGVLQLAYAFQEATRFCDLYPIEQDIRSDNQCYPDIT